MWKMGFYLQGQSYSNWISVYAMEYDYFYYMFWTADFLSDQLSLTVHVHKLVKRLLCCIQGQGHSEYLWLVKLSMVMHHHQPEYHSEILFCYDQGQSHNLFY